MPQLDPYLSAIVSNGAQALELADDELATLRLNGVARPITRSSVSTTSKSSSSRCAVLGGVCMFVLSTRS